MNILATIGKQLSGPALLRGYSVNAQYGRESQSQDRFFSAATALYLL
jgi:hypothetical protein